jgi:chromatin structure-remodeling complex subunit RSC9
MDSADEDNQRTPAKTDAMEIDDPLSAGRYPRRKLIPDPVDRSASSRLGHHPTGYPSNGYTINGYTSNGYSCNGHISSGYLPHVPIALPQTQALSMHSQSALLRELNQLSANALMPISEYHADYAQGHLRQDPRPTQMYQPDLGPRRNFRTTASPQASPAPRQEYHNASADPRNPTFSLDKYEPRQPHALTLRQVITPGNAPEMFRQRKAIDKARDKSSALDKTTEPQDFLKTVIPNGMNAPNIYIRCLYGLRSGVLEEQEFALHHLAKVSFERGEKYRFEGFPLLAESLLEKVLEITQLIYGVEFDITYDSDNSTSKPNTLNASHGTPDLLNRLRTLDIKIAADEMETADFARRMEKLNEAALVIRNMVFLEDNASFIARFPLFRDFLIIALNLPSQPRLAEFQHYALEMTEQVTRYLNMEPEDALYTSLLSKLSSYDRGTLLSALHAIMRIGINTSSTHELRDVPIPVLQRLVAMLLLEGDDQLTSACLDFVYQYTATPANVKAVLASSPDLFSRLTPRLVTLMLHNATLSEEKLLVKAPQKGFSSTSSIPNPPQDLLATLVHLPEPERSSRWLRCCFEESRDDEITQIAIWQAYQGRFAQHTPFPAADFIKNVSNTFSHTQAQVINLPQPRFIIKGIRPRRILVGPSGENYFKCLWELPTPSEPYGSYQKPSSKMLCESWHSTRKELWTHLLSTHLGIHLSGDESLSNSNSTIYRCCWQGCTRNLPFNTPNEAGIHLRQHVPKSAEAAAKAELAGGKEAEFAKHSWYMTPTDEKGHPCGIPYMSVMVLRNLARFAMRNPAALAPKKGEGAATSIPEKVTLTEVLFGHVKGELWNAVSVNKTLVFFLSDLIKMIEAGEAGTKIQT